MLRIYTLGIQKKELKELFRHDEISESIYTKNLNIIETQTEHVEQDHNKLKSRNVYLTNWAGVLSNIVRRMLFLPIKKNDPQELYLYYRTQYLLISKVLEELYCLENSHLSEIFDEPQTIQNVIAIYQHLKAVTEQQMQHEIESNQELLDQLNEQSAINLLQTVQNDTLNELHDNEIITAKLHVLLNKELNHW
jgi:CPA1 family monovalent cation:H+ antiporter